MPGVELIITQWQNDKPKGDVAGGGGFTTDLVDEASYALHSSSHLLPPAPHPVPDSRPTELQADRASPRDSPSTDAVADPRAHGRPVSSTSPVPTRTSQLQKVSNTAALRPMRQNSNGRREGRSSPMSP